MRPGFIEGAYGFIGQIALHLLCEFRGRGVAFIRDFSQGFQANGFDCRRDVPDDLPWWRRSLLANFANDFRGFGRDEGRPSGQDFIKNGTQTVNVGPFVDQIMATLGLLGGHVCRGSQELTLHCTVGASPRFGVRATAGTGA